MGTYYKYAERGTDAYVDWNVIGKTLSDNLLAEKKFREDKKAKIDEDSRLLGNTLDNSPQGEFQDGNKFMLEYASNAQQARLMQDKLLKSGTLSLKDYTVQRQNLSDGTTQVTELQKLYQDNYKSIMGGIQSGDLQAMNTANMMSVEGFADFSKSQAVINPNDGTVSLAYKTYNEKTGTWEITKDSVPVSVLKGKILTRIPTFKVNDAMNSAKKELGVVTRAMYDAATTIGAGTITELTGPAALEKYPEFETEIKNFQTAIDGKVKSWLVDPYHVSSLLTQEIGYSAESYTYDKDEAAKDKSKILLKINPSTQLPTLDTDAPNYQSQYNEAKEFVKSQLISRLDSEVKISTTSQMQRQSKTEAEYGQERLDAEVDNYATNLNNLLTGTPDQRNSAQQYFRGLGVKMDVASDGITIEQKDGNKISYPFSKGSASDIARSLIGGANPNKLPEDAVIKRVTAKAGSKPINTKTGGVALITKAKPEPIETTYAKHIDKTISVNDIKGKTEEQAQVVLADKLSGLGMTVEQSGYGDNIYIINGNGEESPVVDIKSDPNGAIKILKDWIKLNPTGKTAKEKKAFLDNLNKTGIIGGDDVDYSTK
jgi:hypothetical protein